MAIPRERPPTGEFGEEDFGPLEPFGEEEEIPWWESYPQTPVSSPTGPSIERPSGPAPALYTGKEFVTEGRPGVWNDPEIIGRYGRPSGGGGGGMRPLSPIQMQTISSRPRPGSFHLQSIERELEQQARIKGLREAGRPERGKPPPAQPWTERLHPILLAKRAKKERQRKDTLTDLQFQIEEMELQKQMEFADLNRQLTEAKLQKAIRQAKEIKKIPKRRKPRPVWGI